VRVLVINSYTESQNYQEIAEIAGISKLQAAEIMKEWQQDNIEDSTRSGRPSRLSDSDICYLKMLSDKDPSAPLAEITRDSGLNVSEDTACVCNHIVFRARTLSGEH
jgi:transposase